MTSATPKPRAGEHTKGPWKAVTDTVHTLAGAQIADCSFAVKAEANARRIVACVNACEGVGTDALEQGNTIQRALMCGLQAGIDCDTLKAQQKGLRDGLVKSVQYINQLAGMVNTLKPKGVHAEDFTEHARALLQRIK